MEGAIPSASSIQAAKEKRERLRKSGTSGDEDYISLSVSKRSDLPQGPHPESRLVREEDEIGEGDDGVYGMLYALQLILTLRSEYAEYTSAQERVALGKKSRKVEAQKRRNEMSEMIADA